MTPEIKSPSLASTAGNYLKNKGSSMLLLLVSLWGYQKLPTEGAPLPFVEFAYTALTILSVIVIAPLIRFVVFQEAAAYAEAGKLDHELRYLKFTPAMVHYWFATAISYGIPIACFATLAK